MTAELGMMRVSHQWQAAGQTPRAFGESYRRWLELCAEGGPLLINSHTGKDYFAFEGNLELLDVAAGFSQFTLPAGDSRRGSTPGAYRNIRVIQ